MLVSLRVIPVYPGLGLKLGSRRGIATDLICGRGDWVRLEAPVGGGRRCGRGSLTSPARASYSNILAAVLVYAVSQLRSSSVKGSVDFRVASTTPRAWSSSMIGTARELV